MKKYSLFREGSFYKGNLHTHTTVSDGKLSPLETIDRYKKNGYSFLGISDHNVFSYYPEAEEENFLSIPAVEAHTSKGGSGIHHVVAFADPKTMKFANGHKLDQHFCNGLTTQELVDYLREYNNMVIYCHPHWSRDEIGDIVDLKNIVGMEIYNHGCQVEWRCGFAEVFYDHVLWHGNYIWNFATDDAHGATASSDYCGGYITVKTCDFSHKGILDAISKGSFYSSAAREGEAAPEILDFLVEDGLVKLWCTPTRSVCFFAGIKSHPIIFGEYGTKSFQGTKDSPITYAEYQLPEGTKFVKVSAEDFSGSVSWSQPILL